jgi:hypothetical protein
MPPQCALTVRAAGRFLPRKKTAKAGNFLDLNRNKKYQLYNSLQDGLGPGWRGWWVFTEIHHPIPHVPFLGCYNLICISIIFL